MDKQTVIVSTQNHVIKWRKKIAGAYVSLKCEECIMKIHSGFFENVKTKSF